MNVSLTHLVSSLLVVLLPFAARSAAPGSEPPLSPTALVPTRDGRTLFIACATGNRVLRFDLTQRKVTASIAVPAPPTGLALSPDEQQLVVTCAAPKSKVCLVDLAQGRIAGVLAAGHTAMAPVFSLEGKTLYVCNRFNHDVSVFDVASRKEARRLRVQREPVAAALTRDGKFLLVANLLPNSRADASHVGAVVSVLGLTAGTETKELRLPNGSGSLQAITVSPDGRYAVVTHVLSRFAMPATQLDRGWMNTNAKTIIDLGTMEVLNTVLLDSVDSGAANPWGVAWSADSASVVVAHAGTHEISVVNFPALLARLTKLPATLDPAQPADETLGSRVQADVPNDLSFLVGLRRRLPLPVGDRGPRAVTVAGTTVVTANYFSGTLSLVDLAAPQAGVVSVPLAPARERTLVRQGEFYFHDASICFQGWQSCATCHPGDGRVDALNWDLLNDGVGNLKNTKSLLLSHRTPPAMSLGVRDTAETAVRAGIRHILFAVQPPEVADALDAYLKALEPMPSPYLAGGRLSAAAKRGRKTFAVAGCVGCHPAGLYTDQHHYNVGTGGAFDRPDDELDTPTLIELWRTAPYLHDGSAATLREVFTERNPRDQHGSTSKLSRQEIEDLCTYLLSL